MSERAATAEITESQDLAAEPELAPAELAEADLLVEEVSIDGMCGVY